MFKIFNHKSTLFPLRQTLPSYSRIGTIRLYNILPPGQEVEVTIELTAKC